MPQPTDPRAALARQVKLHLESLRAAGVEFIPVIPPLAVAAAPQPVVEHPGVNTPGSPGPEPAADPDSPDARRHALTVLAGEVAPCDRCPELFSTRTNTVFGVGPVDPEVCFVGEAPGADEDATGEPFVGRAGQLLNKIIAAMGFRRGDVYICNTIKCRPPNNRTPFPEERHNCRGYFDRQLALVRPRYIVCLGATAAQNVLGVNLGIGKLRGKVHKYKDIPVVCTFHPSFLLRDQSSNQQAKRDCWEDMKRLLRTMGRPVPGAKAP